MDKFPAISRQQLASSSWRSASVPHFLSFFTFHLIATRSSQFSFSHLSSFYLFPLSSSFYLSPVSPFSYLSRLRHFYLAASMLCLSLAFRLQLFVCHMSAAAVVEVVVEQLAKCVESIFYFILLFTGSVQRFARFKESPLVSDIRDVKSRECGFSFSKRMPLRLSAKALQCLGHIRRVSIDMLLLFAGHDIRVSAFQRSCQFCLCIRKKSSSLAILI